MKKILIIVALICAAVFVLHKCNDANATPGKQGETRLMLAAQEGDADEAARLLRWGADIEATDDKGNTALIHATNAEKTELIELLAEKGAELNAFNKEGKTALHMACCYNKPAAARCLLKLGAAPDIQDKALGYTALTYAVISNDAELVSLLLRNGASRNIPDKRGNTPAEFARQLHYARILSILLHQ